MQHRFDFGWLGFDDREQGYIFSLCLGEMEMNTFTLFWGGIGLGVIIRISC